MLSLSISLLGSQISQAILLDQFIMTASNTIAEAEAERQKERKREELIRNTLDPLMAKLSEDYIDDADLTHRLHNLFKAGASFALIATPG